MKHKAPDIDLPLMRGFVAEATGLDFPPSRWSDLQRGVGAAAKELGFRSSAEYAARLMSGRAATKELELLADHLTVGETYFFREPRSFEVLATQILPALIRERRDGGRRLRIWSAACCTGEEPYSIAILLRRMLPDWERWDIRLLATDINARFLRKAISGQFGEWSFRGAPSWLRPGYFKPTGNGSFEILPEIKRMVSFSRLNLADSAYSLSGNETGAMDVIFCRNVLMYFAETQAQRVIQRLYRAQGEEGWLIVGVSESPTKPIEFKSLLDVVELELKRSAKRPVLVGR